MSTIKEYLDYAELAQASYGLGYDVKIEPNGKTLNVKS